MNYFAVEFLCGRHGSMFHTLAQGLNCRQTVPVFSQHEKTAEAGKECVLSTEQVLQ